MFITSMILLQLDFLLASSLYHSPGLRGCFPMLSSICLRGIFQHLRSGGGLMNKECYTQHYENDRKTYNSSYNTTTRYTYHVAWVISVQQWSIYTRTIVC